MNYAKKIFKGDWQLNDVNDVYKNGATTTTTNNNYSKLQYKDTR